MQKLNEISLAHYLPSRCVILKKKYGPVCNTKNLEIQIEYIDLAMVQHVPDSRKRKCMIKHTLNTFLQYEQ